MSDSKTPCLPHVDDIVEIHDLHTRAAHNADGTLKPTFASDYTSLDKPFFQIVYEQHKRNILLWHEEDKARSRTANDTIIADVKRSIDAYNQERNDFIEKLDESLEKILHSHGVVSSEDAPWNSETPGSIIDRLSILSLKIFHMGVQVRREDAPAAHTEMAKNKERVLCQQRKDLATASTRIFRKLCTGEMRMKLYRQYKMYNDPNMNPALYKQDPV